MNLGREINLAFALGFLTDAEISIAQAKIFRELRN